MPGEIKLSVVLAVYNKQNSIKEVFEILFTTIEAQLKNTEYELIFVDDASSDNSSEVLKQFSSHPSVVIANHAKNMGQLKSFETGLKMAKGQIVVFTSCDLQNPLEKTVDLYRAVNEGYDCAIAYRSERVDKGISSLLSSGFLWMVSILFPKFPRGGFDFAAFNARVRERLLQHDFDKIFLQLEILRTADSIFQIPIKRELDNLDSSSWNYRRRIAYAMKVFRYIWKK